MKIKAWYILTVLIFSLLFASCQTPEEKKKLEQLRQMAATEMPVHPSFSQIDSTYSGVRDKRWSIHFFYQSSASYDSEVRGFYLTQLTAKGWSKFEEDTYGSDQVGMRFRKGEYIMSIYHDPTPSDSSWDYSIAYAWGKP